MDTVMNMADEVVQGWLQRCIKARFVARVARSLKQRLGFLGWGAGKATVDFYA